jgi:thiol-disulfide isomerase/thioredoxin
MLKTQPGLVGTLMPPTMKLVPSDFTGKRLNKTGTLAVLFEAEWCPFCRRFSPVFDSALAKNGMTGARVDLSDEENLLWETFSMEVVPTVMIFKKGELVYRRDGALGQGLPDSVMDDVISRLPVSH